MCVVTYFIIDTWDLDIHGLLSQMHLGGKWHGYQFQANSAAIGF